MRFKYLAGRTMKEIYRDPITVILGVLMPVLLLLLFSTLMGDNELDQFSPDNLLPGIVVFSYAFLTMFSALLLAKDKEQSFLTRLRTSPLRPTDYVLAYTLPYIPIAIVQTFLCMAAALLIGVTISLHMLTVFVILIPTMLVSIGLGLVFGVLLTENQVSAAGSFVLVIASLFSGAWMDLRMIGGVFETVGYALPFAHGVDAARAILAGRGIAGSVIDLVWVLGYAVVLFLVGTVSFRRLLRS